MGSGFRRSPIASDRHAHRLPEVSQSHKHKCRGEEYENDSHFGCPDVYFLVKVFYLCSPPQSSLFVRFRSCCLCAWLPYTVNGKLWCYAAKKINDLIGSAFRFQGCSALLSEGSFFFDFSSRHVWISNFCFSAIDMLETTKETTDSAECNNKKSKIPKFMSSVKLTNTNHLDSSSFHKIFEIL